MSTPAHRLPPRAAARLLAPMLVPAVLAIPGSVQAQGAGSGNGDYGFVRCSHGGARLCLLPRRSAAGRPAILDNAERKRSGP